MSTYVINPFTQKKITVGGKVHQLVKKIQSGPGSFEDQRQEYLKATHSTTKSKYMNVPEQYFCGSKGGYPQGSHTFPVDSEKRCRAALSYAHNAPNPEGIRQCALAIAAEKGWNCGKYSKKGSPAPLKPHSKKGGHGGPVPQPKKKTAPKKKTKPRKMTGYQLFTQNMLPQFKEYGMTGDKALAAVDAAWKDLAETTKDYYNEEAEKINF